MLCSERRLYSLSQCRPFEELSLGLCVTNPFELSCIMTSDWCWCRWVRTICCSLHLLLSGHHSDGGPVCWRFQNGGASAGSRPSPLSTHNAPGRQVPCCFGGSSRPGPRFHVHLRKEFFFWTRNTWRLPQFYVWYVLPITDILTDTVDNQILWTFTPININLQSFVTWRCVVWILNLQITVPWVTISCNLTEEYQRFKIRCYLNIQSYNLMKNTAQLTK
jgi:hypothetical protein